MNDVLAELNAVADYLDTLNGRTWYESPAAMAARLRAAAAQIVELDAVITRIERLEQAHRMLLTRSHACENQDDS